MGEDDAVRNLRRELLLARRKNRNEIKIDTAVVVRMYTSEFCRYACIAWWQQLRDSS